MKRAARMLACSEYEPLGFELPAKKALQNRDASHATPQPTLSVAEVRRSLAFIRKSWEEQQGDPKRRPFYLSDAVGPLKSNRNISQSIEHFALSFVLAHHTRRSNPRPCTGGRPEQ
jgi:hypothetical protein